MVERKAYLRNDRPLRDQHRIRRLDDAV